MNNPSLSITATSSTTSCVFVYIGIGEEDLWVCAWWYSGNKLSSSICIVFNLERNDLCAVVLVVRQSNWKHQIG